MTVKIRNPVGIVFLAIFTAGIYYYYWFYSVNSEAAVIARDENANPGLSLLAITFGWLLIVPPFISHWRTARRVAAATGRPASMAAMILLAAIPLWGAFYAWWIQGKMNRYARGQQIAAAPSPALPA